MRRFVDFQFEPNVSIDDVEASLHLAMFAVEGLAGRVRVRLDAHYRVDPDAQRISIASDTHVAQLIVRVFAGLLIREFGEESFSIEDTVSSPKVRNREEALA